MQRITVSANDRFKENDLQLSENALSDYNPDCHCCSRCGKKIWAEGKVSSYIRGVTHVVNGQRVDDEIRIPVYLCSQCGKSSRRGGTENGDYNHAILTDNLIPFTYFTLIFVLTVLKDYATRTSSNAKRHTVAEICEYWNISVSTLYRWKERYKDHYDAWANSTESIRKFKEDSRKDTPEEAEAEALDKSLALVYTKLTELIQIFFSRFLFSFLQPNRLTHFRPLAQACRT